MSEIKLNAKREELITNLKLAVADKDNESAHVYYDEIIETYVPLEELKKLRKIVKDVELWYS